MPRALTSSLYVHRVEQFRVLVEHRSISGLLHLPRQAPAPCVITAHGLFSSKDSDKFISIADYFTARGFAVIRFDFGGCGESDGTISDTTVSRRLKELEAVVAFARQHPLLSQQLGLLGSSLGGYVSLLYAAQEQNIIALSVWSTPYDLFALRESIPAYDLHQLKDDFFVDAAQHHLRAVLSDLATVQIIHGKNDTVVPPSHAEEIFSRVSEPKELHIIPAGDHSLTDPADRTKALELSARWFQMHLHS